MIVFIFYGLDSPPLFGKGTRAVSPKARQGTYTGLKIEPTSSTVTNV